MEFEKTFKHHGEDCDHGLRSRDGGGVALREGFGRSLAQNDQKTKNSDFSKSVQNVSKHILNEVS